MTRRAPSPGQLDLMDLLDDQTPAAPVADAPLKPDDTPWVVVSCGMEKLRHRAPAGEMYRGSYHRAARRAAAALTREDRTLILSGKHGLLRLTDEITPYEMPIGAPGAVSPLLVSRQMRDLGIARPGTRLIMLAGKTYSSVIRAAVRELNNPRRADREPMMPGQMVVDLPLLDTRGIGEQLAVFARIARGDDPADAAIAVRVDGVDQAPAVPAEPAPEPVEQGSNGRGGAEETGPGAAFLRAVGCWPDGRRVTWTAPHDTVPGVHAGDVLDGYRCPHCRQIEPGEYGLQTNHGVQWLRSETWHPDVADAWEDCTRQRMTELQARAALGMGKRTYQCRCCLIWRCEQLLDVDGGPYCCAGEREAHDWRPATPNGGPA